MVSNPDSPLDHPLGLGVSSEAATLQVSAAAWARAEGLWAAGARLPWLHQEVARRMAERLAVIRMQPQVVLEWDALAGQSCNVLQAAYPNAQWSPVARSAASLQRLSAAASQYGQDAPAANPLTASPTQLPRPLLERLGATWRRWWGGSAAAQSAACATSGDAVPPALSPASSSTAPLPRRPALGYLAEAVPPAQAHLLWSNLGLHTHAQPGHLLQRWHAALAIDGFLMFSTFGPDTLREWRSLWEEAGWGPVAQPFRDMHDWGDDLVAAGFADPVMDQETLTLTWADADSALAELRTLGRNAHPARHPGCRTPRWKARLRDALQSRVGPDGRISLTFEIIYGHAFRPVPRARMEALSTVSLDDMRHMVQTARRSV